MSENPKEKAGGADVLYRVYCVRDPMPPLEKLLARLVAQNPHNPPGSYVFPPGRGMRRLQDALGASSEYFVMGYERAEAPDLFEGLEGALADQGTDLREQDRLIVRDAKLCVVLRAQLSNPDSNDYIETLVHLADAFRELLLGIVWDVRMERVFGHEEWRERVMEEPFSMLNHVRVRAERAPEGDRLTLSTRGLRKFGSADLVVADVPADLADDVRDFLRDFAEHLLQGDCLEPGEPVEYRGGKVRVVEWPQSNGDDERLAFVDEPGTPEAPAPDARAGMPRMLAVLRAEREKVEGGRRAGGGKGAS